MELITCKVSKEQHKIAKQIAVKQEKKLEDYLTEALAAKNKKELKKLNK